MTTERGSGTAGAGQVTKTEAVDVTVADAGSLITATNVEDALQEIATALNVDEAALATHINDLTNPHSVTAAQLGLGITDTPEFAALDLTPGTAPTHEEGRIAYDSTSKTFIGYNDISDVTLNIGEESWVRALNNTGSQIDNGDTVYISGSSGGVPTIALAKADVRTTSEMVGVATHDIANGAQGIITTEGLVRGLNTVAFSGGDHLYLSPTTAGEATATKPTGSDYVVEIGHVMAVDASDGSFLINVVHPKDLSDIANLDKATKAEMEAETADKYPDAALVLNHPGTCKAHGNFTGSATPTLNGSFNVTSVTSSATGVYAVTLPNTMATTNYTVNCSVENSTGIIAGADTLTTTTFRIITRTLAGAGVDTGPVFFTVFGDLA